jgi:glycosyltransferase involved in cell wall biosynthesis
VSRRIVLLTPGHSEPGGAQRRSSLLARGLAERGWEVRAVTRAGSMRRLRVSRTLRMTVVEVPGFGKRRLGGLLFLIVAFPLGLLWGARARAYVSLQLMSTSTVAAGCALLLRRPFLALSTTTAGLSEIDYLQSTRTWRARRWLLGRADYLLAQTEEARPPLMSLVQSQRVAVLPNPVDVPPQTPPLNGRPRALFAGRLSAEKNLFRLLDAWKPVAESNQNAHLSLLGVGGDFRSIESELRSRVADDPLLRRTVSLPGWAEDVAAEMAKSDVFVLASTSEGMSNALLEACALGRVVIASDIPSNRAVLGGDYPFLVSPDDTDGFTKALRAAFDDGGRDRQRVSALARERVAPLSAESVVRKLEGLIDGASRARS